MELFKNLWSSLRQPKNDVLAVIYKQAAQDFSTHSELGKDFSKDYLERQKKQLIEEVAGIQASPEPIRACRTALGSVLILLAKRWVLIMPPPPDPDPTGFRGEWGFTGELKNHITEICKLDNETIQKLKSIPESDWWNFILLDYRRLFAWSKALNLLRVSLGDCLRDSDKDYFRILSLALCIVQESHYRMLINMPDIANENDPLNTLRLSTLGNMTWDDFEPDPVEVWEKTYEMKLLSEFRARISAK